MLSMLVVSDVRGHEVQCSKIRLTHQYIPSQGGDFVADWTVPCVRTIECSYCEAVSAKCPSLLVSLNRWRWQWQHVIVISRTCDGYI